MRSRMKAFSAGAICSSPNQVIAPSSEFPETGWRPLVSARNSVKRSRIRIGTGQPRARKHEISALA